MANFPLLRQAVPGLAVAALMAVSSLSAMPAFGESAQVIEEIVVTARKRAENAQDVPAAVAAFGAEELEERGIDNLVEVARLSPNVTVNETNGLIAGAIQVFIRGIGNDPGFDQGVGVYVDDVYLNRQNGALLDVYDIERIEILRGPQGHLYGRNTIGGAVKYVSAEPDNESRAKIEAKVGTDNLRRVRAGVSGALIEDKVFGSLAFTNIDEDGYQTNLFNDADYASQDKFAIRGTLIWQAAEALRFKVVMDRFDDESNPYVPTRVGVRTAPPAGVETFQGLMSTANFFGPPGLGARIGYLAPGETLDTSLPTDEDDVNTAFLAGGFDEYGIETQSFALTADWDINEAWSLRSITAQRDVESSQPFDFDGSHQLFINTLQEPDTEDFSQELQLNYNSENLNAVFGVYYLDGQYENAIQTTQSNFLRLTTTHVKRTRQDDRDLQSRSIYANVDWDINDQWQLSVGGRHTTDERELDQLADVTLTQHIAILTNLPDLNRDPNQRGILVLSPDPLPPPLFVTPALYVQNPQVVIAPFPGAPTLFDGFVPHFGQTGELLRGDTETVTVFPENKVGDDEWSEFTPSVKLSFHPAENTMLYGGVSTGFKSGGFTFSGDAAVAPAYEPETVTTYSLGLKTTLLDGSLRLNIEAFQNDYEEKQVDVIELQAGGSLVQQNLNVGEVESRGVEVEMLWLPPIEGLVINLNAGYLDIDVTEYFDQIPGGGRSMVDVSSQRALGYAPELTWQARVQYTASLGGAGSLTFGVDANYRDEMYTDSPIDLTDPFLAASLAEERTLTNAFITYDSPDDRWRVTLEGKNLTDERELENTFQVSNFILGGYNRGRTWGLTVGYDLN